MDNLHLVYPEIFISLSVMFLLVLGVFKKKSSNIIYNLSILSLLITLVLILSYPVELNVNLFNNTYIIDYLSSFAKILILISGIFIFIAASRYLKIFNLFKIEYSILILCSMLGMMVMVSANDLIVLYIGLELQSL